MENKAAGVNAATVPSTTPRQPVAATTDENCCPKPGRQGSASTEVTPGVPTGAWLYTGVVCVNMGIKTRVSSSQGCWPPPARPCLANRSGTTACYRATPITGPGRAGNHREGAAGDAETIPHTFGDTLVRQTNSPAVAPPFPHTRSHDRRGKTPSCE